EVVWLRPPSAKVAEASDPPLSMLIPILIFAAATIWFGFDTQWTVGIAEKAAQFLLGGAR
ncbi:MAG: monovalent cation/H+ antiporter subunit D family protein, partial [Pseudolabrys sp.]